MNSVKPIIAIPLETFIRICNKNLSWGIAGCALSTPTWNREANKAGQMKYEQRSKDKRRRYPAAFIKYS